MSSRPSGLLAQIEAGVLNDGVQLSTLLQKVIVLGGRAGSEKMRAWARHELRGYTDPALVPDYRNAFATLNLRITNRVGLNPIIQRVTAKDLPDSLTESVDVERATLWMGIGELEALVAKGDETGEPHYLSPSWADQLAQWILQRAAMSPTSVLDGIFWMVPNTAIKGLLVQVRTALAELVAELTDLTPEGQDVPTKAAADQAIHFILTGERATINITTQHSTTGPNVSAPGAQAAVVASENSTAVGSQTASGDNSIAVGVQNTHGDNPTVVGRDAAVSASEEQTAAGWWARLRKRGVLVAFSTIIGGIAGVVGAVVAVLTLFDWTPW